MTSHKACSLFKEGFEFRSDLDLSKIVSMVELVNLQSGLNYNSITKRVDRDQRVAFRCSGLSNACAFKYRIVRSRDGFFVVKESLNHSCSTTPAPQGDNLVQAPLIERRRRRCDPIAENAPSLCGTSPMVILDDLQPPNKHRRTVADEMTDDLQPPLKGPRTETLRPKSAPSARVLAKALLAQSQNFYKMTPKEISDHFKTKCSLSARQAQRVKEECYRSVCGNNSSRDYSTLESLLQMITLGDIGSRYLFERKGDLFDRAFVCLRPWVALVAGCLPIIGLDGCHLRHSSGTLLTAVAMDVDHHINIVALAIVQQEDGDNWVWFCQNLKEALASEASINIANLTFMSDRDKGLAKGVREAFVPPSPAQVEVVDRPTAAGSGPADSDSNSNAENPGEIYRAQALCDVFGESRHRHCIVHLNRNFKSHLDGDEAEKQEATNHLIECSQAQTLESFRGAVAKLQSLRIVSKSMAASRTKKTKSLATFLFNLLDAKTLPRWAVHAMTLPSWLVHHSNFVESLNSVALDWRALPVTFLLKELVEWQSDRVEKCITKWTRAQTKASGGASQLCERSERLFAHNLSSARYFTNDRLASANHTGSELVFKRDTEWERVTLSISECSCGNYLHSGLPCWHLIFVLGAQRARDLIHPIHQLKSLDLMYKSQRHYTIPKILLEQLSIDPTLKDPSSPARCKRGRRPANLRLPSLGELPPNSGGRSKPNARKKVSGLSRSKVIVGAQLRAGSVVSTGTTSPIDAMLTSTLQIEPDRQIS